MLLSTQLYNLLGKKLEALVLVQMQEVEAVANLDCSLECSLYFLLLELSFLMDMLQLQLIVLQKPLENLKR